MKVVRKASAKVSGVFTIMLIIFAALCALGYALYMLYNVTKILKANSDENSKAEEVAEGPTETGDSEVQRADSAASGE